MENTFRERDDGAYGDTKMNNFLLLGAGIGIAILGIMVILPANLLGGIVAALFGIMLTALSAISLTQILTSGYVTGETGISLKKFTLDSFIPYSEIAEAKAVDSKEAENIMSMAFAEDMNIEKEVGERIAQDMGRASLGPQVMLGGGRRPGRGMRRSGGVNLTQFGVLLNDRDAIMKLMKSRAKIFGMIAYANNSVYIDFPSQRKLNFEVGIAGDRYIMLKLKSPRPSGNDVLLLAPDDVDGFMASMAGKTG